MFSSAFRSSLTQKFYIPEKFLTLVSQFNCRSIYLRLQSTSTSYDDLRSQLESIRKQKQKSRIPNNQAVAHRKKAHLKGLAIPSPTFDDADSQLPLNEEEYFHYIKENFPFGSLKLIDYNVKEVASTIPEFPKDDENWMFSITPTESQITRPYVNDYVRWITGVTYSKTPNAMPTFIKLISTIIEHQGKHLTLETYNMIIKNYSVCYEFYEVRIILEKMKQYGIFPNTVTYNIILRNAVKTKGQQRIRRVIRLIVEMLQSKSTAPDILTLNIILNSLGDLKHATEVLHEMEKHNLPLLFKQRLLGFNIPLRPTDYKRCGDNNHLKTALLNYSLLSYADKHKVGLSYSKDIFIQSYIEFKSAYKVGVKPDMYTLRAFMNLILNHEHNLPFALAFFDFFQRKYKDFFDYDSYEEQLCEIYGLVTTSMIRFSDSPVWTGLVSYLYKKSLNHRGETIVTPDFLRQLRQRGEELRYFGFDPTRTLTLSDAKILENLINNLKWLGEDPVFFEDDNTLRYRKAYATIGCGTDITHGRFNAPLSENIVQRLKRGGKEYILEEDRILRDTINETKIINRSLVSGGELYDQWRKMES